VPLVELVIFLLIIAAGLELLSRKTGIPRPILLVISGTLLALVPAAPTLRVQPDVVFFIFLPPLLYWAAINTSYREFRQNGRDIMLLAVGLVVATALAVAAVAHTLLPVMSWPAAFALGAAVGPTDAVAATSVMRRFGVPRNIVSILEGESLVNDATSLVIFEMAITAANTSQFSLGPALLSFVWAAGGGVVLGLVAGWCIAVVRRWLRRDADPNPVIETSLSLLTPYLAFQAAESIGVSGVLAVVVVGLYLGHASARLLTAQSRLQAINMWQVVDFLLEGLLFIIVGLGLPLALSAVSGGATGSDPLIKLLVPAALVCLVVIVLRLVWVFPASYAPRYVRRRFAAKRDTYPPWQNVFFEGWAGLRGAVSLVLALSIPFTNASGAPIVGREMVIFLTFAVILVTLVGQGLTLQPLIAALGLEPDHQADYEETRARLETARAALHRLDALELGGSPDDDGNNALEPVTDDPAVHPIVGELYDRYKHLIHRYSNEARTRSAPAAAESGVVSEPDEEAIEADLDERRAVWYRQLRLGMIDAERTELIRMRDDGEISDEVLHRVERDLDLEQTLLMARSS
jgi:CPA1 family monovalent cation:H+ antiporter